MIIYRIEHKITGFGPYCSSKNGDKVGNLLRSKHGQDAWGLDSKWPAGLIDFDDLPQSHYFGFNSLQSLFNWFDKEDRELLKEYYITIYDCKNFVEGKSKKQLIFELGKAKIIKFIDLSKWN